MTPARPLTSRVLRTVSGIAALGELATFTIRSSSHRRPPRLVSFSMVRVLLRLVAGLARSRASLVAENEILRLQLAAAKARLRGKRLRFSRSQRWLIGKLATVTAAWRSALAVVQPATVLRWHRGLSPPLALAVAADRAQAEQPPRHHS